VPVDARKKRRHFTTVAASKLNCPLSIQQGLFAYLDPRDWHTTLALRPQTERLLRITMASFMQNILVIFPPYSNGETPQPVQAQAGSHPTTAGVEEPIYFYDSDKPYFESANCH